MTMATSLPGRRDEAWRYSDLKALERAHALPANDAIAEAVTLADGETRRLALAPDDSQRATLTLEVPAGVSATLVESLGGGGWLDRAVTVRLGAGARLTHVILQTAGAEAVVTAAYTAALAADARYQVHLGNVGGALGRVAMDVTLATGADFTLGGVLLGNAGQTVELVSRVVHAEPGATSQQTVRSVLAGKATANYLGKILVAPGAQKTDAAQSSKALLLARTASANTKPELEIHADDVKCAHGATVGELDAQALFYMATRGIDPAEARALLTQAFLGDVLDAIADEALREEVSALAIGRLRVLVAGA